MSLTRTEAQEHSNAGRPIFSWVREEDGSFTWVREEGGSGDDFPADNLCLTNFQYLRVVLRQYLDRRKNN